MEVENAVNQTQKEIGQRFDFKGGKSDIELDKVGKKLKITADDDFKLRSIHQILEGKLVKRGVDLRILKYEKEIPASGNVIRQEVILRSGIEKEDAKEITKAIKDSKLKVQAQIQDEQVRVTAKSIDELQATMAMLRGKDMKTPIQFVNMRS
jgi:uncharacterized protein YajQ (UPF0234 family)